MPQRLRSVVGGLGGAAAMLFVLILVAPNRSAPPYVWLLIVLAVISSTAPLVLPRLSLVAIVQTLCGAVSPLCWPSASMTVFRAVRQNRLAVAATMTVASVMATTAAVLLTLPHGLDVPIAPSTAVLLIALSITGMIFSLLGGFVGAYRQRQAAQALLFQMRERDEAVRRVEQARSAERERLTGELHDTLGNRIALLRAILETDADDPEGQAAQAQLQARKAGEDLRALVSDRARNALAASKPMDLAREALTDAREAGMPLSVSLDARLDDIPRAQQLLVFEVLREGITNAMKYSSPGLVVVVGTIRDAAIDVMVSSPAAETCSTTEAGSRLGLMSLTERARSMGGVLEYGTVDRRFDLRVRVPLSEHLAT